MTCRQLRAVMVSSVYQSACRSLASISARTREPYAPLIKFGAHAPSTHNPLPYFLVAPAAAAAASAFCEALCSLCFEKPDTMLAANHLYAEAHRGGHGGLLSRSLVT